MSRDFCCSASYCLWVLSKLIETFKATSTKAVINFIAARVAVCLNARTYYEKKNWIHGKLYFRKKKSYLRIGKLGEQRDHVIHQMLIVNDGILALLDQQLNKVTKVATKLFPKLSSSYWKKYIVNKQLTKSRQVNLLTQWVFSGFFFKFFSHSANDISMIHGSLHF